jgi:uncharacterized membrane protein YraQ (UPF0718 family)
MFGFFVSFFQEFWNILVEASFFIIGGILIAGLLKTIMNPNTVIKHLGTGRYLSVIKASFFGVPLPL